MRCKDIEHLIIDLSEKDLSPEELSALEQHIANCTHCARFQDDLNKIRMCIKTIPLLHPSPDLVKKTRMRCYAEISPQNATTTEIAPQTSSDPIPILLWAALFSLILLTVIVVVPALKDIILNKPLSFPSAAVLTLMIQNAVMLVFAPILLRKLRWKKQDLRGVSLNANAL